MKNSYLDYAMSVIIGRALPDVRDGLKPVHRRILYAMMELGLEPGRPYKKSARIVGEVMGKYHPHGDSPIYESVARMAQDFTLRYILVDGQGNFGSIDGDPPAAMRYTEARLRPISMEILADIDKDTVDFMPNFDESLVEPVVLPSKVPNLLINGSSGIAVGMATNIPPHNLGEVCDALILMLKKPDCTIEELMQFVSGPDFPTGGVICGNQGIFEAYSTGKGIITIRGKVEIEEVKNHDNVIITEIPYEVNKSSLVENIARLVEEKKIGGVTNVRDESSKEGIRIVLEVRKGENTDIIVNQLYSHTQLQTTYGIINLALVNRQPKLLTLKEMLCLFLEHRRNVVERRTRFELHKAEERHHILLGLKIAVDHIDKVISLIRNSGSIEEAREKLMKQFHITQKQADAILALPLGKLTKLERNKIEEELEDLNKKIAELKAILASKQKVDAIIEGELKALKNKYADKRRTEIGSPIEELSDEDLVRPEDIVVTVSSHGYIKRLPLETYRRQRRGGRGILGAGTKEDDFVRHVFICSTIDQLLIFTENGRVYWLKGYLIPEASRIARGKPLVNLLKIQNEEKIASVIPVSDFSVDRYILMITKNGIVKKTALAAYSKPRQGGIIGISLKDNDRLIDLKLTDGNQDVMLFTKYGFCIRFNEREVKPIGRTGMGVIGIRFKNSKDEVVGGQVFPSENPTEEILTVSSNGSGKRTYVKYYRRQKRGGKGVIDMKVNSKTGYVVKTKMVKEDDEVIVLTMGGMIIRLPVNEIRRVGRSTLGVKLINLNQGDRIADVAIVRETEEI
ncbi:MAG: DNA gyrase subunit A [Candidatus Omnitrophica bacterium]|nr:DNA gyrase subunit A [Candidatus Omnitrophota bacterium]